MSFKVADVEREAEQDPYRGESDLVSQRMRPLLNEPRSHDSSNVNWEFVEYAEELWRQARRVLLWWTPARVEEEALRRAGDDVDTSVIAREHHLFLAIYLKWLESFWRWAPTVEDEIVNVPAYTRTQERDLLRKARLLREGIVEVLGGLERKGAAAEAHAMDIRLRIDHEKIAQLIAGHDLVSRLRELVDLAAASNAGQQHLRELGEQLLGPVERAARVLGSIDNAADFACDKLVQMHPEKKSKLKVLAVALLSGAAGSTMRVFLERLLRLLG